MRKILLTVLLAGFCLTALTGCGAFVAMGGGGILYQDTKTPSAQLAYYGPTSSVSTHVGTATATSILGILATGDASLDAAMKAGNITKVHHVDVEVVSYLSIITTYKLIVYGE
jgi:hypothetical protein